MVQWTLTYLNNSLELHPSQMNKISGYVQCIAYNPFGHKLLQIYNDFVWTVSRLNRDMNKSLAAVRLPIRKPGPHNSRSPIGTLK